MQQQPQLNAIQGKLQAIDPNNQITSSTKANCSQFYETKTLFACYTGIPTVSSENRSMMFKQSSSTPEEPISNPPENDDFFEAALTGYTNEVHKRLLSKTTRKEFIKALVQDETVLITIVCRIADAEFKVSYM